MNLPSTLCDSDRMPGTCEQCATLPATKVSPTGRSLCESCFAHLAGLSAVGTTLAGGGDPPSAVGAGIAATGFTSSMDIESQHRAGQRAKLAATEGFWARLKVRLIG